MAYARKVSAAAHQATTELIETGRKMAMEAAHLSGKAADQAGGAVETGAEAAKETAKELGNAGKEMAGDVEKLVEKGSEGADRALTRTADAVEELQQGISGLPKDPEFHKAVAVAEDAAEYVGKAAQKATRPLAKLAKKAAHAPSKLVRNGRKLARKISKPPHLAKEERPLPAPES